MISSSSIPSKNINVFQPFTPRKDTIIRRGRNISCDRFNHILVILFSRVESIAETANINLPGIKLGFNASFLAKEPR